MLASVTRARLGVSHKVTHLNFIVGISFVYNQAANVPACVSFAFV